MKDKEKEFLDSIDIQPVPDSVKGHRHISTMPIIDSAGIPVGSFEIIQYLLDGMYCGNIPSKLLKQSDLSAFRLVNGKTEDDVKRQANTLLSNVSLRLANQ